MKLGSYWRDAVGIGRGGPAGGWAGRTSEEAGGERLLGRVPSGRVARASDASVIAQWQGGLKRRWDEVAQAMASLWMAKVVRGFRRSASEAPSDGAARFRKSGGMRLS